VACLAVKAGCPVLRRHAGQGTAGAPVPAIRQNRHIRQNPRVGAAHGSTVYQFLLVLPDYLSVSVDLAPVMFDMGHRK